MRLKNNNIEVIYDKEEYTKEKSAKNRRMRNIALVLVVLAYIPIYIYIFNADLQFYAKTAIAFVSAVVFISGASYIVDTQYKKKSDFFIKMDMLTNEILMVDFVGSNLMVKKQTLDYEVKIYSLDYFIKNLDVKNVVNLLNEDYKGPIKVEIYMLNYGRYPEIRIMKPSVVAVE